MLELSDTAIKSPEGLEAALRLSVECGFFCDERKSLVDRLPEQHAIEWGAMR